MSLRFVKTCRCVNWCVCELRHTCPATINRMRTFSHKQCARHKYSSHLCRAPLASRACSARTLCLLRACAHAHMTRSSSSVSLESSTRSASSFSFSSMNVFVAHVHLSHSSGDRGYASPRPRTQGRSRCTALVLCVVVRWRAPSTPSRVASRLGRWSREGAAWGVTRSARACRRQARQVSVCVASRGMSRA